MITENSLGQKINNPENFWRWFGNSVTVDEQGRPLVLYHGTKQRFNTFKTKYDDGLVFFAYDKQFSLDWGGNLSAEQEETKNKVNEPVRKTQNSIAKWYQNKYGSSDTWSDEIWKEYRKQIKHLETQAHHKADIETKIMPVYLKVTKIFYPEKDYELVLDDIIDYYDFPRTAPDHSKEIEELKKEADKLVDNFKKSGRNEVSDEEHDAMEEIQGKINSLIREQNVVKRFEEYDLQRIKKGAWIYFEHKEIIDKIWSLGYDAIQLSEKRGEPTTLAVRNGNNQIKSIFNNGQYNSSDNIYESLNKELERYL